MELNVDLRARSLTLGIAGIPICFYSTEPFQFLRGVLRAASGYYRRFEVGDSTNKYSDETRELEKRLGGIEHWKTIYYLVRETKPRVCVETGTGRGRSSAYILSALKKNGGGVLHSIERDEKIAGALIPAEMKTMFVQHCGDSRRVLPRLLNDLRDIDFFHHDGNHSYSNIKFELRSVWPHLSTGGVLAADDASSNDAFLQSALAFKRPFWMDGGFAFLIK